MITNNEIKICLGQVLWPTGFMISNHLPLTTVGSNLIKDFGLFHVRKLQLAYGTSVDLLRCPLDCLSMPEIRHGRAYEVFLHQ